MNITKATYKTSVVHKRDLIQDGVPEFAFVGRSNVGKSSLINMLVGIRRLAKTSSTPGLTKMVNYFDINDLFRFVDLPGYGFAKVGKGHLDVWAGLMGEYLVGSPALLTVFVLLDCRHLPTALDGAMIDFLVYHEIPFMVLLTKADKLSRAQLTRQLPAIASSLKIRQEMMIPTSSETGLGKEKILHYIETKLEMGE